MKPTLIIFLVLVLSACAAPVPTQPPTSAPPQPTQTAAVILQTVVVTVVSTQAPTDLPPATFTPLPQPTEVPPTQAVATQPPAQVAAPTEAAGGLITLDDALGAGFFTGLTRSSNDFSLRCQLNKQIMFSTKPVDPNITQVDFFYRIEDRATGAVFDWQNAGRMIRDANGGFSLVFAGENVNANFRKPDAWFDYQFIGSNVSGVVGRSEKIEQQVTYTFDCP